MTAHHDGGTSEGSVQWTWLNLLRKVDLALKGDQPPPGGHHG
jgi:hypothetical protein